MSDRDASGARRSASTVRTRVLYPFPYHLASRNSPPSPSIVDGAAAAEAKPAEQTGKTRRRYTKLAVPMRHPRRDDSLTQGASARRPARRAETIGSKLPKNPHGARSQGCGAEGSGCATSGVNEPGGRPSLGPLKNISAQQKNRHGGAALPLSPHAARPASRELRNAAASTGRRVAKKCAFGAEWLNFELQVDGKHANLRAP